MKKIISILLILVAIGVLFWQQSQDTKQVWFQIIAFVVLFYGMSRLSAKVPSKHKLEEEEENKDANV